MLVTTLPGRNTAHGTAGTCFAVGGAAAGTAPFVCRERSISLLKSLILKGGYKAEVGSNQLKLHFHSALHAKPLKALKKILEAVQHKIALAHGSKKQTSCLDLKIENLQE